MKRWTASLVLGLLAAAGAHAQTAPVTVSDAWVRASVQGQSGTGGFMRLTAREAVSLVSISTPAARVAEIHEMRMDGDVMRMRAIAELALAPGKPVELKPGGYHLMLTGLVSALAPQSSIPITLTFRDAKGRSSQLQLSVPVALRPPQGGASGHGTHGKH